MSALTHNTEAAEKEISVNSRKEAEENRKDFEAGEYKGVKRKL